MKKQGVGYGRMMVVGVMMLASLSVFANEGGGNNPCQADLQKFCKDVPPGDGRLMKCMNGHHAELSPACQQKMQEKMSQEKGKIDACRADKERLCKDVQPGEGRIVKCLKEHQSDLSAECKGSMGNVSFDMKDKFKGCREAREKACPGLMPADPRFRECIMEHKSEISEKCHDVK